MTQFVPDTALAAAPHIPFVELGAYPVRPGNVVQPLVDGDAAFRRIGAAVDTARLSVWLTAAFFEPDFPMPDGRGSVLDLLDRAVARGVDVRVLFWRPNAEMLGRGLQFPGSAANRALLQARGSRFRARWDRTHGPYCQHQKMWLIDAGQPDELAFVGGINLTKKSISVPGHPTEGQRHDLYLELAGPAATDVHHNFVQRWNEASDRAATDGCWADDGVSRLAFPTRLSAPRGGTPVQIQRNLHAGRYSDGTATPGGAPHDIAAGESTVRQQYLCAIDAARDTIYIENQAVPTPEVSYRLAAALERGVAVVALAPAEPEDYVREARRQAEHQERFTALAALGRYPAFTLVGAAGRNAAGRRHQVYVHSKAMLVDDAWATIGSCNLHAFSMHGHTELNVAFWDPPVVRALRCQLLAEHLERDTGAMDDRTALALYRQLAQDNGRRRAAGDDNWLGMVFGLDPARYGE